MRVGLVIGDYGTSLGGTETACMSLKNALIKENVEVYIICAKLLNTHLTPKILNDDHLIVLESVDGNKEHSKIRKQSFIDTILNLNLDIMHIQDIYFLKDIEKLRHITDIKMVYTTHLVHHHGSLTHTKKYRKLFLDTSDEATKKRKKLEDYYRKHHSKIFKSIIDVVDFANSTSYLSDQELPYFIDRKRIERIPIAVDFSNFQNPDLEEVNKLKEKYNIKDDDIVLVTHGRLCPEKIQDNMIELFSKINNDKVKLILIGGGLKSYLKKLHKLIKKLNLEDRVILPGVCDYKKLKNWFFISSFGFYNSCQEVQWLSYMEYLASSKPIIVRDMPSTKDTIINGYNGYKFKTEEEFIKYINIMLDDKEIKRLSKNVLESIKDFDILTYGKKMKDLYTKMLNTNKRS